MSLAAQALEKAGGALRELFEVKAIVAQLVEQVRDFKSDSREHQRVFEKRVEDRLERLERRLDEVHKIALSAEARCNEALGKALGIIFDEERKSIRHSQVHELHPVPDKAAK
jgi:hypothetical protein